MPRLPEVITERLVGHFGGLQRLLAASIDDLQAVEGVGEAMGLDYAGVDFSLTADGRVLVFEANAAMCVHTEPEDGVFAAKNAHVTPIIAAFQRMLAQAAAAPDRTR